MGPTCGAYLPDTRDYETCLPCWPEPRRPTRSVERPVLLPLRVATVVPGRPTPLVAVAVLDRRPQELRASPCLTSSLPHACHIKTLSRSRPPVQRATGLLAATHQRGDDLAQRQIADKSLPRRLSSLRQGRSANKRAEPCGPLRCPNGIRTTSIQRDDTLLLNVLTV